MTGKVFFRKRNYISTRRWIETCYRVHSGRWDLFSKTRVCQFVATGIVRSEKYVKLCQIENRLKPLWQKTAKYIFWGIWSHHLKLQTQNMSLNIFDAAFSKIYPKLNLELVFEFALKGLVSQWRQNFPYVCICDITDIHATWTERRVCSTISPHDQLATGGRFSLGASDDFSFSRTSRL